MLSPPDAAPPQNIYQRTDVRLENQIALNNDVNVVLNQSFDTSGIVRSLDANRLAYVQTGQVLSNRLYEMTAALREPVRTTSTASGKSWGGAQTTTTEQYEEQTVTNGEAYSSSESWTNGTANDSGHAANLWFSYKVRNTGSEYAREIGNLTFNVYLGDDPDPIYTYFVAPDLGGDGKFRNFMPGEEHTYSARTGTHAIPLTLEQLRALDVSPACDLLRAAGQVAPYAEGGRCPGGKIRILVEDYTYGIDELFYQDAINAGVDLAMEDGTADGDEAIDHYVLPTWGDETVLDVLARYFPHSTDENGMPVAIWTPEVRSDTPAWCDQPKVVGTGSQRTLWCRHALSVADWWNIYTNGLGDGSEGLQDTPASPGSVALFRFNQDSDLDGYSDRSERKLGTDPRNAASHPRPELLAGLHTIRQGGRVTATLSLLNSGLYDAYGVEAVMIAPNDSISIINNTVGGSGRVRAQREVIVGSSIKPEDPLPDAWTQSGHAVPAVGGYYTGAADRTYTFTVACAVPGGCDVGAGTWTLNWSDGAGAHVSLPFGSGYQSPTLLNVGGYGVKVGLISGRVQNGESFQVNARTPRDTFQYEIAAGHESDFTPPVVLVSYNDPQGNHRFALPPSAMALSSPTQDLMAFSSQMLPEPGVDIVTTTPFTAGANTVHLLVNNPTGTTLTNAHLFLESINISGTVVSEVPVTVSVLPPGPSVQPVTLDTASFSPGYNPAQDYIVMAFWTDYQGNILDTAARPLSSFQSDPRPASDMASADETWDFGEAQQGTLLQRTFTLASTGYADLLTHLGSGITLTVQGPPARAVAPGDTALYTMTLKTDTLPVGDLNRSIQVRTSDPAHPVRNITIQGSITPMPPDAPGGAVILPLDWTVTVTGTHAAGEWITFTHSLGPNPETLHPVKVLGQDGALKGVGKYATDFAQGTAAYDMFGDGRDGPLAITVDTVDSPIDSSCSGTADSYTLAASNQGFIATQTIMIHQSRGAGAGTWMLNKIAAYSAGTITLAKPLNASYVSAGNDRAQVLVLKQYTDVAVNSGTTWTAKAWNGATGGMLAFLAKGRITVEGEISATARGFGAGAGGNRSIGSGSLAQMGQQGEGVIGPGANTYTPNGSGGGGGGAYFGTSSQTYYSASGGAGGGSSAAGQNGHNHGEDPNPNVGLAGGPSGSPEMSLMTFGGGGGGGGGGKYTGVDGHAGGRGGGIVYVAARVVAVSGSVKAQGAAGIAANQGHDNTGGGGGGGAGGSITIVADSADLGSGLVAAVRGAGGAGYPPELAGGGDGADGRIRVDYCDSLAPFSTTPAATTRKASCHIAEQVELTPYTGLRLKLPVDVSGSETYRVQYGRRLQFAALEPMTTTLQLPKQLYSSATLDALVNNTDVSSGPLTLSLDIGNDGTADWSYNATTSFPVSFTITNTVSALNAFLVAQTGVAWGADVNVPVHVSVDRQADVMLTNLALTPVGAKTRYLRLPARQYADVRIGVRFEQPGVPSGPLAFTVDVGADGSIDWSAAADRTFPVTVGSPNLAAAINAYLVGKSGEVDVPIRIVPSPSVPTTLDDFVATPQARPDLIAVSLGGGSGAVEADTVSLSASLRNSGALDTGPFTASFFATSAEWGPTYIGTAFVPAIAAGGNAPATISWNTTGFSGAVPVRVVVDPYNRVTESSEANNVVTATLSIATRPDLSVPAITLSDPEPVAGQVVTASLRLRNGGQTAADGHALALYRGNPEAGGSLIGAVDLPGLIGEADVTVPITWTAAAPGPYRLFARADGGRWVNESDEGNNDTWLDVYVGQPGPVLLDSGAASDPLYAADPGYGYVDQTLDDLAVACAEGAAQTLRKDPGGQVVYRFDHLLPAPSGSRAGRYYHLDLSLAECDQNLRQQTVKVDGIAVAGPIDLGDQRLHQVSVRLDPALYADHTISVTVETPAGSGTGAVVADIALYDVDYRYTDSGGAGDLAYLAAGDARGRPYGYLDASSVAVPGMLPYQSARVNQSGSALRYRYDGLVAGRAYQLNLTFWQASGSQRMQKVQVDGQDAGESLTVASGQVVNATVEIPATAYENDGSVIVSIVRMDASTGAVVNEIALEELTVLSGQGCAPSPSPYKSITYGTITVNGLPAPKGTVVRALNKDQQVVGCTVVRTPGHYGFMDIYGRDTSTTPQVPGMADNEIVEFRVNGALSVARPSVYWHDDRSEREVSLEAGPIQAQAVLLAGQQWSLLSFRTEPPVPVVKRVLASIEGRYSRVLGEDGIYDSRVPEQFQSLREMHAGLAYYAYITSTTTANLLVQGLPVPVTKTWPLHSGWNWIGYPLTCTLPIAAALADIDGSYDRVLALRTSYNPALPGYSTLNELEPGLGYLLHATAAVTLTYPSVCAPEPASRAQAAGPCAGVRPTPRRTLIYGEVTTGDNTAWPVGATVEVLTPRGDVAGCFAAGESGRYGLMQAYGEDTNVDPPIPGFRPGEQLSFRVNGLAAVPSSKVAWQDDWADHRADLVVDARLLYLPWLVRER